jgi:hypothetical protein
MRLLGIDCGVKNLAYCLYNTDTNTIEKWDVIDVSTNAHVNLTYIPDMCINYMDKHLYLLDCDKVLIEKQPPRNGKMRVMEAALYCYFTLRGKLDESKEISSVETYSAKHKLGGMLGLSGKKSYGARKKAAIVKVTAILSKDNTDLNDPWLRFFCEHKKRDDLSDALLMILAYIQQQTDVAENEATKRILAKKPKDGLTVNAYTPGNLKFVLREHMKVHSTTDALTAFLNDSEQQYDLLQHVITKYTTIEECLERLKLK